MADLSAAADAALQIAEKLRGITDLAEAVKSIGNIDQTIAEKKAALKSSAADLADAQGKVIQANKQLDATKQAIADANQLAVASATELTEGAKTDAAELIASAKEDAAKIRADARKAAAATKDKADQVQAAADERLSVAQAAAVEAEANVAAIRAEYDELAKKMKALREAAQQIAA